MSKWDNYLCELPRKMSTYKNRSDKRSRFKCDLDTICFSSSFRRLQDKAQVFPIEEGDFSRTRLTHSIEVMSVAESLGLLASNYIKKQEKLTTHEKKKVDEIPTILRAASLIHDLGNPPFGHITEGVIKNWFQTNLSKIWYNSGNNKFFYSDVSFSENSGIRSINGMLGDLVKDFIEFDSNAQSIRIVNSLQRTTSDIGSMNLSYTVLSTIIKYPYNHQTMEYWKAEKYGVFKCDSSIFKKINDNLQLNYSRHPLTFLLEAADDIAYLSTDIEDAAKKGLITINDFLREINDYYEKIQKELSMAKAEKSNDVVLLTNKMKYFSTMYKNILELSLNYEKISETEIGKSYEKISKLKYENEESLVVFRKVLMYLKGQMIDIAYENFCRNYDLIVNLSYKNPLLDDGEKGFIQNMLRTIERKYIYYGKNIVKSKIVSEKVISTLLDKFVINTLNMPYDASDCLEFLIPRLISDNFYNYFVEEFLDAKTSNVVSNLTNGHDVNKIYGKLHMVLDEITGMTDSYALKVYDLIK